FANGRVPLAPAHALAGFLEQVLDLPAVLLQGVVLTPGLRVGQGFVRRPDRLEPLRVLFGRMPADQPIVRLPDLFRRRVGLNGQHVVQLVGHGGFSASRRKEPSPPNPSKGPTQGRGGARRQAEGDATPGCFLAPPLPPWGPYWGWEVRAV